MQQQNTIDKQLAPKSLLHWLGWFLLSNAGIYCLIGLHYVSWVIPTNYQAYSTFNAILAWMFILLTWIGQFTLLAFLPGILALPFIWLKRLRLIQFYAALISATALLLLIADSIIFAQYRFHLNGVIWEMLFSQSRNEIFNFSALEISLTIGIYLGLIFIEFYLANLVWRKLTVLQSIKYQSYFYNIPVTCLFLSYMMFLNSVAQPVYSVIAQHPQAFPLYTRILAKLLPIENSFEKLETAGRNQFRQPIKLTTPLHYPLNQLQCQSPRKPYNILFIVIDAWRFDMVDKAVTPNIFNFAPKTWQFKNHLSGGNSTQPGIFSLFYALPATYWNSFLQEEKGPVFINQLLQQGYEMAIYASAPLDMPPFNKTVFKEIPHLRTETAGSDPIIRDQNITKEFITFLQQRQNSAKPFFGFLFYDAPHSLCNIKKLEGPFKPMLKTCNRLILTKNTDPAPFFNRYKNALYAVDQNIAQVLGALKKYALLNNTIIVITGDHGEEFNDNKNGYWGHSSNFTHYQIQTPLLLLWPHKKPQIFKHQTTHFDIVPTLLDEVFHCSNPHKDYTIGRSLFNTVPDDYLIISSYISYGIIQPNRITTLYPTGNYKIEDAQGKKIENAQLDFVLLQRAISDMKQFYRIDRKHGS